MSRRAVALLAAAAVVAIVGVGVGTVAGATASHPTISLSPDDVVPGQRLLITGSGWPAGTSLSATVCGADAVSGTQDCAPATTVQMVAAPTGTVWMHMTTALPPKPCPCVILVTGIGSYYTEKVPVTLAGAATAPVPQPSAPAEPQFRVVNLQIAGGTTVASSFGGAAPRTLEFRVDNVGTLAETPVLLGQWGTGKRDTHVIKMPAMRALGPGQSAVVQADFSLPALSVGLYTARVEVQVVGYQVVASASASTSTWPIALLVVALLLLELVFLTVAKIVRGRRRRAGREVPATREQESSGHGAGTQPEYDNGLMALGARIGAGDSAGGPPGERGGPNDPTRQAE